VVIATLEQANKQLQQFRPRRKWYRHFCKRSAVALILREAEGGLQALMIKRAEREGDPWSGHMAFPGGRAEATDRNDLHTARRETWEEIGLDTETHTEYLGQLSDTFTRSHRRRWEMVVTPHLFAVEQVPRLRFNHEVAEVVWVPLNFLANRGNRQASLALQADEILDTPCYYYQQRWIWGLSLRMLEELLTVVATRR